MKQLSLGAYKINGNPTGMPVVVVALINDEDILKVREQFPDHLIVGWQKGVDVFIVNANSTSILDTVRAKCYVIDTPETTEEGDVCKNIGCKIMDFEIDEPYPENEFLDDIPDADLGSIIGVEDYDNVQDDWESV